MRSYQYIKDFSDVTIHDVPQVGGKNASLGEMIQRLVPKGVSLPGGFVTTADAFRYFMKENKLDVFVKKTLEGFDASNVRLLQKKGSAIRNKIKKASFPKDLEEEIIASYRAMELKYKQHVDVAVRSSATAEDLPGASFAGQQETYLNVRGTTHLLDSVRNCFASLYTDRAIAYRQDKGFDHLKVALSVGVQKMVRSDKASSGVMFTLDTESGFQNVVLINGSWGLGEMIVQGEVIPDEFFVFKPFIGKKNLSPIISKHLGKKENKMIYGAGKGKATKIEKTSDKERNSFCLSDKEVLQLGEWATIIENHYSKENGRWTPMDIEWAKDGVSGKLYIVQARPETIHAQKDFSVIKEYVREAQTTAIVEGASVGNSIATGKARVIMDVKGIHDFKKGEVLVTDMTDPDWVPIMKIASAIVTDKGGRTSHAAIVSRELGIPAIVGSGDATKNLSTGQMITVDTTGSEGYVFDGAIPFKTVTHNIKKLKKPNVKLMVNVATPETAFEKSFLPVEGVGLAREEFIIASDVGIHPQALIEYHQLKSQATSTKPQINAKISKAEIKKIVRQIEEKTVGYEEKTQYYVDKLAYGIAKIGAAFYPRPVIVRFSDFKTNEYRQLIGGVLYEPEEGNPMLGWRGASRYYHPEFEEAFALEVKAIKKVREEMGLSNVETMVPFCRTIDEGKKVRALIERYGLRKKDGVKVYVMCEIPSNVLLAEDFLNIFDGMSIGSNDLTQLVMGLDRDGNERIRGIADANNPAVMKMVSDVVAVARKKHKYIGICGQAPSDHPNFAVFLVKEGIESMSLNSDSVIPVMQKLKGVKPKKG
jgi:pyruvate,water dikinase